MSIIYFLLFILILVFAIAGLIYYVTAISMRMKYFIIATLFIAWAAIFVYSYYQNKKRIYIDKIYYLFMHDKDLECVDPFGQKVIVNRKNFNFVSGTLVFVGKEKTPFEGLIIQVEKCKEKR